MRTTITLDPDTERMLRDTVRKRGVSFKQAVNDAIRSGLKTNVTPKKRFIQKSFSMGSEQYFRWDKALAMAEAMQDEELARKLSLNK